MTYNAGLPTTRDRIRLIVGDTSNDVAAEMFPDATYDAVLTQYTNWKRAAADMAEAVAVQLDRKLSGMTAVGDVALQWTDQAKTLRAKAIALRAEAVTEDASLTTGVGQLFGIRSPYLTGGNGSW